MNNISVLIFAFAFLFPASIYYGGLQTRIIEARDAFVGQKVLRGRHVFEVKYYKENKWNLLRSVYFLLLVLQGFIPIWNLWAAIKLLLPGKKIKNKNNFTAMLEYSETLTLEKTSDNPYEYARHLLDEMYESMQKELSVSFVTQTDFELILFKTLAETSGVLYEVLEERVKGHVSTMESLTDTFLKLISNMDTEEHE